MKKAQKWKKLVLLKKEKVNMGDLEDNGSRKDFGPKEMHKAVCTECGNECEVPFKPSEGRPVFCKECFAKRRKF